MKMNFKGFLVAMTSVACIILTMISCSKNDSKGNNVSELSVYLTDGPGDYDQVLVAITSVEAKIDTSTAHCHDDGYGSRPDKKDFDGDDHRFGADEFGYWMTLDFTPGTYDLLTLRNGVDTLLASGTIDGKLRKIRVSITSVTVVKNGVSTPVKLMADAGNYLYIAVQDRHMDQQVAGDKLWVDFDVSRSIVEINGELYLKPVLKPFCDKNFAGLEGLVSPADASAIVTAYNSTDTATAIPGPNGYYRIRGLQEGTYTLIFKGSNGYADTTIAGVQISKGRVTKVAPVVLKK